LRVRIKELAQEARFIRIEENRIKTKQKIKPPYITWDSENRSWDDHQDEKSKEFFGLKVHRRHQVRPAARAAQLAYGFLRDVPYRNIEKTTKDMSEWEKIYRFYPMVKEVKRLVKKFAHKKDERNFDEEVDKWLNMC